MNMKKKAVKIAGVLGSIVILFFGTLTLSSYLTTGNLYDLSAGIITSTLGLGTIIWQVKPKHIRKKTVIASTAILAVAMASIIIAPAQANLNVNTPDGTLVYKHLDTVRTRYGINYQYGYYAFHFKSNAYDAKEQLQAGITEIKNTYSASEWLAPIGGLTKTVPITVIFGIVIVSTAETTKWQLDSFADKVNDGFDPSNPEHGLEIIVRFVPNLYNFGAGRIDFYVWNWYTNMPMLAYTLVPTTQGSYGSYSMSYAHDWWNTYNNLNIPCDQWRIIGNGAY